MRSLRLLGVGLALLALGGCRLHFDAVAGDAELCSRATTLRCDGFDGGISADALNGDVSWLPSSGRTGGALRTYATQSVSTSAHYDVSPAVIGGPLYARVYMRVLAGPPIQRFLVLMQLDNDVETGGFEKLSVDFGKDDHYEVTGPFADISAQSVDVSQRDAWACVVLAIDVDGSAGSVQLLVDGNEVARVTGKNTLVPGGFSHVSLGATVATGDPDAEVWFDDFVLATEPIGC